MHPYRTAPASALVVAPRTPGRLLTWWLDVVGAVATIVGLGHARRAHAAAVARQAAWERAVLDAAGLPRVLEVRFAWSGGALVSTTHVRPALDSHDAPCPANTNAYPIVARVENVIKPPGWTALNDEAHRVLAGRKTMGEGEARRELRALLGHAPSEAPGPAEIETLVEAIASDPMPLPFVSMSPAACERMTEELAKYLEEDDDETRDAARKGGR